MRTATAPVKVVITHPKDFAAELVAPKGGIRFLEIPTRRYLMIDGDAKPGEKGFSDAISSLYPVAYTLHFALKRRGVEAPVGALGGLYWIGKEGPISSTDFASVSRRWTWRLMLPVPDEATGKEVSAAIDEVRTKKNPPLIDDLRCEEWGEGPVAQIMHIGPYSEEMGTIERLHAAIAEQGMRARGCHHEIYISDPNRTRPERLKTLIRQPVEPAAA